MKIPVERAEEHLIRMILSFVTKFSQFVGNLVLCDPVFEWFCILNLIDK